MQAPAEVAPVTQEKPRAIRARALVVALLFCFPVNYMCANQGVTAIFSIIVAPVSAVLILLLANIPLRLWLKRAALSQADFIVIFSLLAVAASIGSEWSIVGQGVIQAMPINARWSATARDYILVQMPDWLIVKDYEQVRDITVGGRGIDYVITKMPLYFPRYLGWFSLYFAIALAMLCINSLMRGAWCYRERLSFPLIQLPVALSTGGGSGGIWKSKHMWIAFGIMFAIDILNGLNYLYPNLPAIPTKYFIDLNRLFTEPPMSQMGTLPINLFPFMAAIGIFMPSDLLFSMVVFYLLRKVAHVAVASQGIPQGVFSGTGIAPGPPYFDEQTWGAVIAMFLGALWVSKNYLKEVWADIKARRRDPDGGVPHYIAFIGLLAASAFVIWFGMYGDLPIPYMIVYFGLFLMFCVVLTRIRAQLGPPTHEFAFFGPNSFMNRFFGNRWLSDRQATWISQTFIYMNRLHRTHPMPYQLEAMKMTSTERINQSRVFIWILVFTTLGFFFSYFSLHIAGYRRGSTMYWGDGETYLNSILNDRKGPDVLGISMTLLGFAVVMLLDSIRFKFPGFPLHPAGYLLSMNFGVDYYWFGLLIALLVKNFVQRYYGLRGYDKLRNVAIGVLIGEYAAETIWTIMSLVTHQSTYTISFNDRSLTAQ